jgi:CubicO group peptidase (beta-lactamase class C family)
MTGRRRFPSLCAVLFGIGVIGLTLLSTAVPPARADDPDPAKLAKIRTRMQKFVDDKDIVGAVTVVGGKDGVVSLEAVGSLDLKDNQPMPKDALFRIASMTKPITAIGIMMLVDEGKLSIDDPVEKHLSEFKGQMLVSERTPEAVSLKKSPRPITLRDLLTHTSGLPGRMPDGLSDLYTKRNHTLAEGVMAFSQRPLDFEPGSKWSYCNPGIDTLGRVIEVVSGQPYEDFLKNRIFEPLGMKDTTFYPTKDQLLRAHPIYNKKEGKLTTTESPVMGPPTGAKYPIPAGGLYSTGADLAKLYQLMLNDGTRGQLRFLSSQSVAEMTKVQTGELKAGFTDGMGWGLGWGVVRTPKGVTEMLSSGAFGHGGAYGTQVWIDPKQNVFVVLLIQRSDLGNSDDSMIRKEFQAAAVEALKK